MPQTTTWKKYKSEAKYPKLTKDAIAEVAIVGGGMAGICTAYLLAQAGLKVIVLEADRIGSGATMYTTAFLTHLIDTDLTQLIKMFGKKKAEYIWQSHAAAIDMFEAISQLEDIDCEFIRCPYYQYANDQKESEGFKEEIEAARSIGFENLSFKQDYKLPFEHVSSFVANEQAKFNPILFLEQLADRAKNLGVEIHEKTEVTNIKSGKNIIIETKDAKVKAANVIIATYYPIGNPKQTLFKKGMYDSYVYEASIPKGLLEEALYQDQKNPYHYFRVDAGKKNDRLIIGGEDHRSEIKINPEKNFKSLSEYVQKIVGKKYKVVTKWNGPILEPSDGLALIGEYKPHQYLATAFSGNGMTYSMITAILLRDHLLNRKNPWTEIYDPKRIPTAKQLALKAKDYAGELIGGAVQNLIKQRKSRKR